MPTPTRRRKPEPTTEAMPPTRAWRIEMPGFIPVSLNKLMGHWARAHARKMADARAISAACVLAGVSKVGLTKGERKARRLAGIKGPVPGDPEPAKRHVRLEITLGKGQRAPDPDNCWKSCLDGLKGAGMLFDDSRKWCSHDAEIVWHRGATKDERGTVIHLEEQ